jgi:cell division transport system ATP-binding protein
VGALDRASTVTDRLLPTENQALPARLGRSGRGEETNNPGSATPRAELPKRVGEVVVEDQPGMIELFHVTKRYGSDARALVDVNLSIAKGEFVFLTGPSGAGKTTLLKLLFCAERATSGQVLITGRNVARLAESAIPLMRRKIGVVFQDFKLLPGRTVHDNVALTLDVLGISRRVGDRRVLAMLKQVGLSHKADSLPPRLSGGEQQRVAIARALVNDPAILLADEPTGNLDSKLTLEIMDLLRDFSVRGTTVVVATHDRPLIERYQKRTITLENGRVVSDEATPRPQP